MESFSIESLSECDNRKEKILEFKTLCEDHTLNVQRYRQSFDRSDGNSTEDHVNNFGNGDGEQVKEVVVAYVCTILGLSFLKKYINSLST